MMSDQEIRLAAADALDAIEAILPSQAGPIEEAAVCAVLVAFCIVKLKRDDVKYEEVFHQTTNAIRRELEGMIIHQERGSPHR